MRCGSCLKEGVRSNIKVKKYDHDPLTGEFVFKTVPEIKGCSRCKRKKEGSFQSRMAEFYTEEIKRNW